MRFLPLLFLLALIVGCVSVSTEPGERFAIRNVTVIDPDGVREDQTVVVSGDEIVYAGNSVGAPAATGTIDGEGRYLIPGLWDMHVHLTYDDRFTPTMPAMFIRWGITSVRDTGGMLPELLPVVARMRIPSIAAPRVWFSGPLQDGRHVVYDGDSRPLIGTDNPTPEAARANVQAVHAAGASFIKIYELVSPEVFEALRDEARSLDMPIASHVPLSMKASVAGPQTDSMEHLRNVELDCAADHEALAATRVDILNTPDPDSGYALRAGLHQLQRLPAIANLDDDRCDVVLASLTNTIQVPTLRLNAMAFAPPSEAPGWTAALAEMPDSVVEDWGRPNPRFPDDPADRDLRFATYSLDMVGRMNRAGVPIGAGTDTPIGRAIPGYSLHRELEMLVEAGLTPLEAITAATVQPARFVGMQDEMGRVQSGMKADLVLLDANPLADIRNTTVIRHVISQGVIVR